MTKSEPERISRLEANGEHMQADVSEIKSDVKSLRKELAEFMNVRYVREVDAAAEHEKLMNIAKANTEAIRSINEIIAPMAWVRNHLWQAVVIAVFCAALVGGFGADVLKNVINNWVS